MSAVRLSIVCLLAWTGVARVPQPPSPDPNSTQKTKPEDRCIIEGTIYSLKTGQPLRKAEIQMRRTDAKADTSYGATTDDGGNYVVEGLDPGTYSLSVSRNGYVTTSYGGEVKKRTSTLITLSPSQHMTKADVKLPSQAVVTGRVVDEDNEPMANVSVQLMARGYQNGKRILMPGEQSSTNDKGEYRIYGVGPGKYWILAHLGRVMMMDQAEVRSSKGGQTSYPATYYPGVLSVAEASQVQIPSGAELNGVDFRLSKIRSFTISGKILDAGASLRTAVQLMPHESDGGPSWDRMKMAMVGSDGRYFFRGVQAGTYDLSANIFSQDNRKSTHAEVAVSDSDVDVPLAFGDNPDLKGTIRFEDAAETLKPGMNVMLQPIGGMMINGGPAELKEDGTFTLKSVAAERFHLTIFPVPEGHYVKSIQLGNTEVDDTTVDLTNGIPGEITVTLSAKGATISGNIQDDQQKPITSGTVVLVPDDRKLQSRYETASPDQNGQFTIKNIHPGAYKLFAFDNPDYGAWLDADWLKPYETKGESIEVKESEKASKNLVIIVADAS